MASPAGCFCDNDLFFRIVPNLKKIAAQFFAKTWFEHLGFSSDMKLVDLTAQFVDLREIILVGKSNLHL